MNSYIDNDLVAYRTWIRDLTAIGMNAHFVTFMFKPIGGGIATKRQQMEAAVEGVYKRILTRTVRNPKAASNAGKLPILIGAFDLPVFKYDRDHMRDIVVNDGLHLHAVWLMPKETRLEGDLSGEFLNRRFRYAGPGHVVQRIVSERIRETPERVTKYVFKNIENQKIDRDGIIILPRSRSEI